MNIILLGQQGSGKGTQAKLLADKFKLFYFESGEFLRDLAVKNDSVAKMIDIGELVPGKELASYICAFLDEKEVYENIIFDGFPRQLDQYNFFKEWLNDKKVKIDLVFVIEVSVATTLKRLALRKRNDDTPEAIKERLMLYNKETLPVISELVKDSKVIKVDGEATVEEIQKDLERIISEKINN